MNSQRTPSASRTRQITHPCPTSIKQDRFIPKASTPCGLTASPVPLLSQDIRQSLVRKDCEGSLRLMKVMDAPNVKNDYHLSLMGWSETDVLAVALGTSLHLYSVQTGQTIEIAGQQVLSAVVSQAGGAQVAVGSERAGLVLYDLETCKQVRSLTTHKDRVATLLWQGNLLLSGSRDSAIHICDTRTKARGTKLRSHTAEVCSLALNHLNSSELASGGNDNRVLLWDLRVHKVRAEGEHRACVKALVWSPWKADRLTSGAGYADRSIKEWTTSSSLTCVQEVDSGAQVSAFLWDRWDRRLISGHGYPSCQMTLWQGNTKTEEHCHGGRVLSLAQGPLGDTVASLCSDETLHLWRLSSMSSSEEDSLSAHSRRYVQAR